MDVVDAVVYDNDSVAYDGACNTMSAVCHLSCFLFF